MATGVLFFKAVKCSSLFFFSLHVYFGLLESLCPHPGYRIHPCFLTLDSGTRVSGAVPGTAVGVRGGARAQARKGRAPRVRTDKLAEPAGGPAGSSWGAARCGFPRSRSRPFQKPCPFSLAGAGLLALLAATPRPCTTPRPTPGRQPASPSALIPGASTYSARPGVAVSRVPVHRCAPSRAGPRGDADTRAAAAPAGSPALDAGPQP